MTANPNPIDALHDSLFDERPKKPGARFERIAAVVFAVLVVGRRVQVGAAQAVVVTTVGFTQGALDVAHDEGVRLVRIHALAEDEDWHGVLKEIRKRGRFGSSTLTRLDWRAADPADVERLRRDGMDLTWRNDEEDPHLEHEDGTSAERILELMDRHPSPLERGEFSYRVELDGPRYVRLADGRRLAVKSVGMDGKDRHCRDTPRDRAREPGPSADRGGRR